MKNTEADLKIATASEFEPLTTDVSLASGCWLTLSHGRGCVDIFGGSRYSTNCAPSSSRASIPLALARKQHPAAGGGASSPVAYYPSRNLISCNWKCLARCS